MQRLLFFSLETELNEMLIRLAFKLLVDYYRGLKINSLSILKYSLKVVTSAVFSFLRAQNYFINPNKLFMKFKLQFMRLSVMALLVFAGSSVFAQKSLVSVQKMQDEQKITDFTISEERGTPFMLKLNDASATKVSSQDTPSFLRSALGLDEKTTLTKGFSQRAPKSDIEITSYQQYFEGIKVEHGVYKALSKGNDLKAVTLEHYEISDINTNPTLSEDVALQSAIAFVGATEYAWDYLNNMKLGETNPRRLAHIDEAFDAVYPKGELVIVDDYGQAGVNLKLAYKFNVYAAKPIYRADIYVDASNGKILLADQDIKHAAELNEDIEEKARMSTFSMVTVNAVGTGELRYAGTRQFITTLKEAETDPDDNDPLNVQPVRYVLEGDIDVMIDGQPEVVPNETRSYDGVGGVPLNIGGFLNSYEITDGSSRTAEAQGVVEVADNNWTADEHYRDRFDGAANAYPSDNEFDNDDTGVDAHWGSEVVIRYWAEIHNRHSFDGIGGKLTNFVHFGDAYDNAFYSNSTMTYGDGSSQGGTNPSGGSFLPLMSLDVAAHEVGHGVTDFTSMLVYARQSGGLNEGFSDLWAATVENYFLIQPGNDESVLPYDPYGVGEQIDDRDNGLEPQPNRGFDNDPNTRSLRYMDDPKAAGDPDCILGVNWAATDNVGCPTPNTGNDQCGVHSNSGVLNKWFYLLTEGSGKALSPGRSKVAVDDEMNDNGEAYTVTGIGFLKSEQISYKGSLMLTPNALFSEMREASILIAQQEYGVDSIEEIATTNAWHGVCEGPAYIAPTDVDIVQFSSANIDIATERSVVNGCNESLSYELAISTVRVQTPTPITLVTTGSTATEGEDFQISTTSITLEGSNRYTFNVDIIDDALVEESETIAISFEFHGETFTETIAILDNDVVPNIGTSVQELLPLQEFGSSDLPDGWAINMDIDPSANTWYFDGNATEAGRAYISFNAPIAGQGGTATYESNSQSLSTLVTPEINSLGLQDVTVTFDWQAGGEFDPAATDQPFDFGSLVYSFDGITYFPVEDAQFWARETDGDSRSGSFDAVIPQVANSRFTLGFRWSNDTNATTSAFSFAIDNVAVTALPANVVTALNETNSNSVNADDDIYFISNDSGSVMARIENASADLGCVNMLVTGSGTGLVESTDPTINRSEKVLQINADGVDAATATYDVTFYFTTDELASFSSVGEVTIMKVEGNDITAANNSNTVFAGGLLEDLTATEGYATFKGSFTGFSSFALAEDRVLGNNDFDRGTVALYPSPVSAGDAVTISTQDLLITNASIYDVRGARVLSKNFDNVDTAQLSTAGLQTGFYFVRLNNDTNKTFKFIVK